MKTTPAILTALALLLLVACDSSAQVAARPWKQLERLEVKVLAEYPHDRRAFTQGLVWHGGVLYESTGQYGASSLRRVDPTTGTVLAQHDVDGALFAEGLALADGRLYQLTWQTGLALVYDAADLTPVEQFVYRGEGWGLAWDGRRLVMSDGSARLTFRDPATFAELSSVEVTLRGQPLRYLNELEVAAGELYANVWQDDRIFRIDPETGKVTAVIDASRLLSPLERRAVDVLNGIAYDPRSETFWLTGKYWPSMFQVVFVSAAGK